MCASITDNILRDPEVSDNMGKQKFSSHKSYGWTSQWDESERLGELVCDTQNGGVALGHWRSVIKSTAMCDQVFVVWAMAGVFQLVRFVGPWLGHTWSMKKLYNVHLFICWATSIWFAEVDRCVVYWGRLVARELCAHLISCKHRRAGTNNLLEGHIQGICCGGVQKKLCPVPRIWLPKCMTGEE